MSDDLKQAWEQVAEQFGSLGRLMKERYKTGSAEAGAEGGADEEEAADATGHGADSAAIRDALDRLKAAVGDIAERSVGIVKDGEVRDKTREVLRGVQSALTTTVDYVGRSVEELRERRHKS